MECGLQLLAQTIAARAPLPVVLGVCCVGLLLCAAIVVPPFFKWVKMVRRVPGVTLLEVLGMHLRKVEIDEVADAMEVLRRCGAGVELATVETHALAGGEVDNVARAYEVLHKARLSPSWNMLAAIDLAGRDVHDLATTAVTPWAIEVPRGESERGLEFSTRDGTKVRCRMQVHLLTNMNAVLGGLQEADVIKACVDEVRRRVAEVATGRDVASGAEEIVGDFSLPESRVPQAWEVVKVELVEVGVV